MEGKKSRRIWKLPVTGISVLLVSTAIALTFLAVTPVIAAQVEVSVNASEEVKEGETFIATINVDSVTNLWFGQFDLSFDSSVINVTDVKEGKINGDTVPIFMRNFVDANTVRVIVKLPGARGVNGSGYLAEVVFEVKGEGGEESKLDISKGVLSDTNAKEIKADWYDAEVSIEEEEDEEEGELTPTPTLSPTVTPLTNVTVTPTPVTNVTVTPTLAPGVTPTPTLAPGVTQKPTPTPTLTPGVTQKPTPTPTPKLPGFEAIFALAVILAIAYILLRRS